MAGRLTWKRTWPEIENDFSASDPDTGQTAGRIYIRNGQEKLWDWFGQGEIAGRTMGSYRGIEPTKQAAADALEAAWFEFKEMMMGKGGYTVSDKTDPERFGFSDHETMVTAMWDKHGSHANFERNGPYFFVPLRERMSPVPWEINDVALTAPAIPKLCFKLEKGTFNGQPTHRVVCEGVVVSQTLD